MTGSGQYAAPARSNSGAESAAGLSRRAVTSATQVPAPAHGAPGVILGLQRGVGNHATSALIQRLRLSPSPAVLQRCGSHPCPAAGCQPGAREPDRESTPNEPGAVARPTLARSAVHGGLGADSAAGPTHGGSAPGTRAAPGSVHHALGSQGTALTAGTRAFFEPLFDHDFGAVRVHTDRSAAASAAAVSARAYTVGNHIVLGPGVTLQALAPGSRLLAHELTHVVQQSGGAPAHGPLEVGPEDSAAEREADRVAGQVLDGRRALVGQSSAAVVHRKIGCPELTDPVPRKAVSGIGQPAHDAIEQHAKDHFKRAFWRKRIPGASFTPWRTEDRDPKRRASRTADEEVKPQPIGGRAGAGEPDLGFRSGKTVELAEIKPATWEYGTVGGLLEGERQLLNYLLKGNADENRGWRRRQGIASFKMMPSDRLSFPPQLTTSKGQPIAAGWCLPGVIGYRALTREETETILCGASDQGAITKFLDSAFDGAQRLVDEYVDAVGDAMTKQISKFTLREGIVVLSRYANSGLKKLIVAIGPSGTKMLMNMVPDMNLKKSIVTIGPPGTKMLMDMVPDMELTDFIADEIGGAQTERLLRSLALKLKDKLLAEVRGWLKQRIRMFLQESFAAACAAAAVGAAVSVADLLRRFGQDLAKRFAEGIVVVARAWAVAIAKELAKTVLIALLIAVVVALLIFFLPEILAGLTAVGGYVVAAAGAAKAAGPQLLQYINQLVEAVIEASPAF